MVANFEQYLPNLIQLKELLNFFNLDLNLPEHLMSLEVDECLKSSKLIINDNLYKFKLQNEFGSSYSLIINPLDHEKTIIKTSGNGRIANCRCYSYNSSKASIIV